jgi:RHS repeat-associated protein
MSYTDNDTEAKILEENQYYPFGLKHENYASERFEHVKKTNGELFVIQPTERKEWQDELELNLYDYGARNYDAAIGMWMNVDPLAEKYYSFSGYGYCLNNPMIYIDPTGMEVEEIDGGVRFTGADAHIAFAIITGKKRNAFVSVKKMKSVEKKWQCKIKILVTVIG